MDMGRSRSMEWEFCSRLAQRCSGGILVVFGAGVGCFDEHSGVVLAFFVVGLECFDERSGGILAVFGAGVECFDERSGGMLACLEQEWV